MYWRRMIYLKQGLFLYSNLIFQSDLSTFNKRTYFNHFLENTHNFYHLVPFINSVINVPLYATVRNVAKPSIQNLNQPDKDKNVTKNTQSIVTKFKELLLILTQKNKSWGIKNCIYWSYKVAFWCQGNQSAGNFNLLS